MSADSWNNVAPAYKLRYHSQQTEHHAANSENYHMPNVLDNSIPIENVHCLIYFLLG